MSDRMTADTNPASRGGRRPNSDLIRGCKALLVAVLTAGLALGGATAAQAAVGGGGVGGGGSSGPSDEFWLYTGDTIDASGNPEQGWGQTSINTFASAMEAQGQWVTSFNGREAINDACTTAMNQAIARSNGQSNRARVVQVGVSVGYSGGTTFLGWGGTKSAMTSWYQGLTNSNYWQPMMPGHAAATYASVHDTFLANIPTTPRLICVALNSTEVTNYDLTISTDKAGAFSVAGSTGAVIDRITVSRGGSSISEQVTARVTLNWGGVEGNGTSRAKNVSVANSGATNSPSFTPSDFGWASWPAGKFWFDVSIAKQGRMKAAVSHAGANDARENWTATTTPPRKILTSGSASDPLAADEVLTSGMFYNAEVTARTNGYASSMTITDSISTDKVWIGSQTADVASATYVRAPNGSRVSGAAIKITRSGGSVTVTGTVTNIPAANQALEYTLVVPTYMRPTGTGYTVSDTSRVCYTAANTGCINGNSAQTRKVLPVPDKSWVLDPQGALNNASVDGTVFAPGSSIGAVVNGSIPAKLAENLSQYSITDDWAGAATYIDFSDATKAKVYLDGVDVTSQFNVRITGTKTIATAKAAFLNATKGLATAKSVKLYVGGTFRTDYNTDGAPVRLTNSGSESWNNETRPTNIPAIFTASPAPKKSWVLDENGALTNTAVDGKTFAPGAGISAVVNGSIPANLGAPMNSYSITDDWSGAARYVDFSDVSKAKVFQNGTDVTSQFDIRVAGNKTTATAKAAFLAATKGLASDATVKFVISGEFRTDYDTPAKRQMLTNAGSESWNGKTVASNTPAIFTVTPDPNKAWVIDENGALSTSDDDRANNAGVDGKVFAPGATISAVVNGSIPADLGSALKSYALTDDWTGAARYVDFSDAARAKVFLDGLDVTDQFTVTVSGNKTVATAKAAFLAATKGRSAAAVVKLFVTGEFRTDYDTAGVPQSLTNAGSESWNGKDVDTNTPAIFTVTPDPNKVWVLDEDGALSSSDKGKTDKVGVDGKTFAPGTGISAVVNGSIPANLGSALESYVITDDWAGAARYVDFSDASKVKVFLDGQNVTSQFDIQIAGSKTIATAKASFLSGTKARGVAGEVKLFITGVFRNDYDTSATLEQLTNSGSESWNGKPVATNTPPIFTVTPKPNTVWVLDENGALSSADKDWTNVGGANDTVFLMNDAVSAVVNGSIPADLAVALNHYSITDDWTAAAPYVDFSDVSKVKVFYNGADVTSGFDVNVVGTTTVAVAKAPFLAATASLAAEGKLKLVISGVFRDDYDTDGKSVALTNTGTEQWNNRTQPANVPPVYVWTPNPNKQVLGSSEESGDKAHDDINGATVWPGQKLEYRVGIDLRIPAGTARGLKSLSVEDVYDPFFIVDKPSVEFWDSRSALGPNPVPRSAYKLRFDEAAHTFTATFTDAWIKDNVDGSDNRWLSQGWLTMRVTGTVSKAIPAGSTVVNQAFQILNGARTATEIPTVEIPTVKPDKESLSTDLVDIDGKTLVQGDAVVYRLLLDGGPSRDKLAYNVHKFGIVDDFDEEFLTLKKSDITVTEKATGKDVTDRFNVGIEDGVAYVFAKTVDTPGVYGGVIPGDPQPKSLSEFDMAAIRPLEDPIIDQALLGKHYNVTLRATVSREQDGHVIQNQARQNIQNVQITTRIVSNPLKDIDPKKDVVISEETKDASIEGTEVRMNTSFNYRLDSSEIPADRAYAASQWSLSDSFDRVHDQFTGIWAIYANADVYDGSTLLFKKGDLLQDSAGHESEPWNALFDVRFDDKDYELTVTSTPKYLDLVGKRPDLANAFSVYAKMLRVAPGEGIENKVIESYNSVERLSNTVATYTIEYPDIAVAKFTAAEGEAEGLHRSLENAHEVTKEELAEIELPEGSAAGPAGTKIQKGIDVGIRFSNAGDVPLKEVTLTDLTHDGLHGQLQNLICAVPADPTGPGAIQDQTPVTPDEDGMVWVTPSTITELPVAGVVNCQGTVREMEPGMTHADTVVVTGKSIFTDTLVKAQDAWFAVAGSTPSIEVVEYTLSEGREQGDRNTAADALVLDAGQAKYGMKVAFDVTNTGDETLSAIAFKNETQGKTFGAVGDVKWLDPMPEDEPESETPVLEQTPDTDAAAEVVSAAVPGDAAEEPADTDAPAEDAGETETNVIEVEGKKYVERPLSEFTELAAGETVLLVGTLTGMEPGQSHEDLASVTAEGKYSGTPVEDSDPWNAKLPPLPPVRENIAVTGEGIQHSDRQSMLGAASMLLLAASVVAFMIRRRARGRML